MLLPLPLQELVKAFEADAIENKRTQLLLSANVAAIPQTVDRAYEVAKVAP